MKKYITVLLLVMLKTSCISKTEKLSRNYKNNEPAYRSMAANGRELVEKWGTHFQVKKISATNEIYFTYWPNNTGEFENIVFDTSGKEKSRSGKIFSEMHAPPGLIENFNRSIFHALQIDNEGIFFAYEYESLNDQFEKGLLITFDESKLIKDHIFRKIEDSVYVYKTVVP